MTFALDTMMRTFFDMLTPPPGWFQMSPKKPIYQDDVAKFEVRDDLASNDPLVVLRLPMRVGSRVGGVLLVACVTAACVESRVLRHSRSRRFARLQRRAHRS